MLGRLTGVEKARGCGWCADKCGQIWVLIVGGGWRGEWGRVGGRDGRGGWGREGVTGKGVCWRGVGGVPVGVRCCGV